MDDLISRAAAIAWFFRPYSNEESYSNLDVERALKAIPAVDAVPVVRCSECKYWYAEIGASISWLPCQEIVTDRNWYCASGKRRDGDT